MLAARGIIGDDDRDALLAGPRRASRRELDGGHVPVRARRRGHPHGDRAAADRDRRPGRRQAAHRALAQRPGRHRRRAVHARRARAAAASGSSRLMRALARRAPSATSTGRCPATPTSSARSRSTSRTTCSRTSGCSCATARASRFVAGADRGAAARRGRARRRELRHRPRAWSPTSSASTAVAPNSIDAVSNRDFVLDYLSAAATCATHLSRLGAELVLWSSEEFGFVELPDAWSQRLVDHAAEEEPRRRRAAAREGAARSSGTSPRCTA